MASFRMPAIFAYTCYFASGMFIHATQSYVVREFLDDEFKTLFYVVLRIGFAILAYYFFRGNSEYQKAMWKEYGIIMERNKDIFDSRSKNEYYHGYHEGYKQACLRNHVETKTMRLLYPEEFPKNAHEDITEDDCEDCLPDYDDYEDLLYGPDDK